MRKRLVQCAAVAALTCVSGVAEADTLEIEAALLGSGPSIGPGFRFGVVLSDRLTLGAGVSATAYSMESWGGIGGLGGLGGAGVGGLAGNGNSIAIAIPVDLKIWLLPKVAGNVSPTIRLVGTYARATAGDYDESTSYSGGGLVGAAYMIDEVIGLSIEGGVAYRRTYHASFGFSFESEGLELGYRASLLLRI